jgi:hypothetical protein
MLRRVALVRTDVSEELSATFIKVTRIGELGTMLAVTSNRRHSSERQLLADHSIAIPAVSPAALYRLSVLPSAPLWSKNISVVFNLR